MKTRSMAWITSIAITSFSFLSFFPSVVKANTDSLTQVFPALAGVELTTEQQTEIENLGKQTLPQLQNVFNSEQQTEFNAALAQGQGIGGAAKSLDLSFSQRRQMGQILKPMKSELESILTPEQLAQMEENVQAMQE